eukprot:1672036-Rhodomonas_salina.3
MTPKPHKSEAVSSGSSLSSSGDACGNASAVACLDASLPIPIERSLTLPSHMKTHPVQRSP